MTGSHSGTIDAREVERFAALADRWWDEAGSFRPLHRINPARLAYICDRASRRFGRSGLGLLEGLRVLDIGCGGGLVSEPLARLGGRVVGVDAAEANIRAARTHAEAQGLAIDYRCATAEALAQAGESFDVIVALEIIEHVQSKDAFLDSCAQMLRPGGLIVLATLSRTLRSLVLGIGAAEYLLGWIPRGTHNWSRFIGPEALASALAERGLEPDGAAGLSYSPLRAEWRLSHDMSVNFLLSATRAAN